jgi:hypothetical protein
MQLLPTPANCCSCADDDSSSETSNDLTSGAATIDPADVALTDTYQTLAGVLLPAAGTYLISAVAALAAEPDAGLFVGPSHIVGDLYDGAIEIPGTERLTAVYSENDGQMAWAAVRVTVAAPTTVSIRCKRDTSNTDYPTNFKGANSSLTYLLT